MPIREFQCQHCAYVWERLNPQGQQECPMCQSKEVKQIVSACNWNFRGLFEHWHLGED